MLHKLVNGYSVLILHRAASLAVLERCARVSLVSATSVTDVKERNMQI